MSLILLRQRLKTSLKKRDDIIRVILFGSFARGTATKHSDIDLIIVMKTNLRFFDRYNSIQRLILDALKPYPVEFFIYTPEEFEKMTVAGNKFIKKALKEGKILYEH